MERNNLKNQGAVFLDNGLSDQAILYGEDHWYESAKDDFSIRLSDLEKTYKRSKEAFKRFNIFRSHGREQLVPDITPDWKKVGKAQNESVQQAKAYLENLDYVRFTNNIDEFIERLRGIHYHIAKLSEYRQYYERLWSLPAPQNSQSDALIVENAISGDEPIDEKRPQESETFEHV